MPLTFLLDEHLRGVLWTAIRHHNARGGALIDVARVGDPPDLPVGTLDPDILLWAEREGRILISRDRGTMPGHFRQHLQAGHHSPGLLLIRKSGSLQAVLTTLALIVGAGASPDYFDRIDYLP